MELDILLDIMFQIVDVNVPTLLEMKDIVDNGLEISFQDQLVKYGNEEKRLAFENYLLIHRWCPGDENFIFYTKREL